MRLPDATAMLSSVSMTAIYQTLTGWQLKRAGREWKGLCPFHDDIEPSLSVNDTFWYCHGGCGTGNAIHFIQRIRNVPFLDALAWLTEYAGGRVVTERREKPRRKSVNVILSDGMVRYFQRGLSAEARSYFLARGLTPATIDRYKLGFGPMPQSRIKRPRYAIPFLDASGKLRTFRFRRNDNDPLDTGGKYMGLTGAPSYVFGLHQLPKTEWAVLAGGQMDAMMLAQMGVPAISGAGESHFKSEWLHDIHAAGIRTLYTLLDNEDAGLVGAAKVMQLARQLKGIEIVPCSWPDATPPKADVCTMTELGWQRDDFLHVICTAHLTNVPNLCYNNDNHRQGG